jgi:hypothetical protein
MKLYTKALIGGVILQVAVFLFFYLLTWIDIDRLMPGVGAALVPVFMVAMPGFTLLMEEGYRHPHHYLLLTLAIIINIIFYSLVIYLILWLKESAGRPPRLP